MKPKDEHDSDYTPNVGGGSSANTEPKKKWLSISTVFKLIVAAIAITILAIAIF